VIEMAAAGCLTAVGVFILLVKLGLKNVLPFEVFIDVGVTIGLSILFKGTYSGLMAAIIGGITLSLLLTISKLFVKKEKINAKRTARRITEVKSSL
jgi:uncharacterized membrane protein YkgB